MIDTEIVSKALAKDKEALSALSSATMPFIEAICRRLKVPESLIDDARQEGALAVMECLPRFDANSGTPFNIFAYRSIMGRIILFLKSEGKFSSQFRQQSLPDMDGQHYRQIGNGVYCEGPSHLKAGFLDEMLPHLHPEEQHVIRQYLVRGTKSAHIAAEMGISQRRVRQIYQSAIETLRLLAEADHISVSDSKTSF